MSDESSTTAKSTTVFLSYSHADEAKARQLAAALQASGYEVWWDALIQGGATYARSIASALEAADAVVVMWSLHSVESDWVRDEAGQGRERRRLVPLSVDGTPPPLGFRQYQVIDLSRWNGRKGAAEIHAVERAIASVGGGGGGGGSGEVSAPRPAAVSRRALIMGGTGAAALVAAGGAFLAWDKGLIGGGSAPLTIAVLPFRNLSGDKTQDYFSDGLTEQVRTALTRINALQVLAATSSKRASENQADPKAIAAELGVSYLLNGSVQRSGETARIAIDLTDGHTGFTQWSQSVDRKVSDIFAVESEIARFVAKAMSVRVATSKPAPGGTTNVAAYEHYLRGRALYDLAKDEVTDRAALADFELATAADPTFALAFAALSRSLASVASAYANVSQLKTLYSQSIAAACRAVELAPGLADGQLALGYAIFAGELNVAAAWPSYAKAYRLGYGNADIALFYALYCSRTGRAAEARQAVDRSVLLDPLNPRAFRAQGSVAYAARRYAAALAPLRRAIELNPKITNAHGLIGSSLMQMGKLTEARKHFEAEPQPFSHLSGLAIVDWRLGDRASARQWFDKLVADVGDSALYQQAEILAQWGMSDEAIARLERARQVGDSGLIYLATDPLLDPLRRQPKFALLLKSLNFG
ncbi:MAG: TIR domain-containing protein [Sphingomicrobium sp.]